MSSRLWNRTELGLRPPRTVSRDIRPEGLTGHYMGGSPWPGGDRPLVERADHSRCFTLWRAIQAQHMDGSGWYDIAYTSGVCPHGDRLEGRGPGVRTGANGSSDGNGRSYAVCYLAGSGDEFTDEARRAFLDESVRLGHPIRWAHRQWVPTACPGDPLAFWIAAGSPLPGGSSPAPVPAPVPAPSSSGGVFPTLRRGSSGSAVRDAQTKLRRLSGRPTVDGIYGPATERAVRDWQTLCRLTVDGVLGPRTWTTLNYAAWISGP
jgi:hypothetical protein